MIADRFEVTEKIGRKWALQANVVLFLIGAILMTAATHQLSYICKSLFNSSQSLSNILRRRPRSHRYRMRCHHRHSPQLHRRALHRLHSRYPNRSLRSNIPNRFSDRLLDQLWHQPEHEPFFRCSMASPHGCSDRPRRYPLHWWILPA